MNKDLRNTFVWFLLATLLVMAAFWQAQMVVIREARARQTLLPPPLKTKRAIRPGPDAFPEDPHDRFVARLATGTSERELGWMVEDFKNAGLDLGLRAATIEEFLAQRKSQHRWYLDALAEGLSLSRDQERQASIKLGESFQQASEEFRKEIEANAKPVETDGKRYAIVGTEPIHRLISPARWLENDAFAPARLSELNPSQRKLLEGDAPDFSIHGSPNTGPNVISNLRKWHPAQARLALLREPGLADLVAEEMAGGER